MIGHKYFGNHAKGGKLGNQLFEYAALYAVAKKNNYEFVFSEKQIEYFKKCFLFRSAEVLSDKDFDNKSGSMTPRIENPPLDLEVLDAKNNTLFEGFFQSEKYFKEVETELKSEIAYAPNFVTAAQTFMQRCWSLHPDHQIVSVHYRKGDYTNNHFPCLPIEYYINCFSQFDPTCTTFIVCSDELQTAKTVFYALNKFSENKYKIIFSPFSIDVGPDFWDVEGEQVNRINHYNPTIDMCVMSFSDHCIIANSSLSWWASWFCDHPDKRILAPPIWFKNTKTANSSISRKKWQIMEY